MDHGQRNTALMLGLGLGAYWIGRRLLRPSYNLGGRVVLITGGSRGLGLVMARQFASEGARLALCARNPEELRRAYEELSGRGVEVLVVRCDIADREQVADMVRRVESHFGRIDVLVNNAGVIEVGPCEVMTLEDFEEAMKINYWGAVYTTLAVLPHMRRRRQGRVVNISSIGGKISVPHLLPYCASKFALTGFSEGLRAELSKDGIVVTTICPHLMRTGSPRNVDVKGQHRAEWAWFNLSDSLPLVSMSAERAARRIVQACKRGEAEVILSVQANLAVRLHGLFPGLTADALGLVNRLLPEPGGIGTARAKGKDSASALSPSILTRLGETAARRNNEIL